MEKPLSVKIHDFCNNFSNLLNSSELPFYILEIYVEKGLMQVKQCADEQRQKELEQYHDFLKKEGKNEQDI